MPPDDILSWAVHGADDRDGRLADIGKELNSGKEIKNLEFRQVSEGAEVENFAGLSYASGSPKLPIVFKCVHCEALVAPKSVTALVFVSATVPASEAESTGTFRAVLQVPVERLHEVAVRLGAWTRQVAECGGQVNVIVVLPPVPSTPAEETHDKPTAPNVTPDQIAAIYEERLDRHSRWVARKASWIKEGDRPDRLHDVLVEALEALHQGQLDLDGFRTAMGFAHRDVLDSFRADTRTLKRVEQHEREIVRELGWDGQAADAQDAERVLIERGDQVVRELMRARLIEEIERLRTSQRKTDRDTGEYLSLYLAGQCELSGKELAAFRGVCVSTGVRTLGKILAQLRRRLQHAA